MGATDVRAGVAVATAAFVDGVCGRARGDRAWRGRPGVRIQQLPDGRYRIRWYVAGHGSPKRQRTFSRKKDAERFAAEIERRKELSELVLFDQANRTVEELANEWWRRHVVPNLADWTRRGYRPLLVNHIQPRLGFYKLREITPEVIAIFRADLESAGVGRHAVRVSIVILQSMFKHAIRWRWVPGPNPVQQVEKASGRRRAGDRLLGAGAGRGDPHLPPGARQALRGDDGVGDRLSGAACAGGAAGGRASARAGEDAAGRA